MAVVAFAATLATSGGPGLPADATTHQVSAFGYGYHLNATIFGDLAIRGWGQQTCTGTSTTTPVGCAPSVYDQDTTSPAVNLASGDDQDKSGFNSPYTHPARTWGIVASTTPEDASDLDQEGKIPFTTINSVGKLEVVAKVDGAGKVTSTVTLTDLNDQIPVVNPGFSDPTDTKYPDPPDYPQDDYLNPSFMFLHGTEVLSATKLESSCSAAPGGPEQGSTTIDDGWIYVEHGQDANQDNDFFDADIGDHPPVMIPLPDNPPPGLAIAGHVHAGQNTEHFVYTFNEQKSNPDGSLTVYGAHMKMLGPTAVTGDLYLARADCGA